MVELRSQAVVLGAGTAGLLAARVLSEFYGSVTIVERDVLPDHPAQRKGVPQGRHLHNFLTRGSGVIGDLFPGFLDELAASGAVADVGGDLSRQYVCVGGHELNPAGKLADPESLAAYQASRPFIEFHLRRRVAALGNVALIDNHAAGEPVVSGEAVTGVRITNRRNGIAATLDADLVVDATGRGTRTAALLDRHGFGVPAQERTPPTWGYSSHLMYIPPGRISKRIAFVNQGNRAPAALLVAYEHDTWMLAIARPVSDGAPPADFTELLAEAGQILPATLMAGLRAAAPVGAIAVARSTTATWRRYDRMSRHPAGLLALGDAVCSLNPIYGQGMTVAALQAVALRDCLRVGDTDLPRRFYAAAAAHIGPVWAMNRANDPPTGTVARRPGRLAPRAWTARAALRAASVDIVVAERLIRVRNLVDPPTRLRDSALLVRILRANVGISRRGPEPHGRPAFISVAAVPRRGQAGGGPGDAASVAPAGQGPVMLEGIYRGARTRVSELAATLTDEQLRTPVAATPGWTVHEVLAHVVGGAADAATERLDGVATEQWTARHVGERRHRTVGELLAEWDRIGPAAESTLARQQVFGPNLAADLICHEADVREALALPRIDRLHWQPLLEVMVLFLRKQFRHSPTVIICDDRGEQWQCGSGEPSTRLRVDGYELLRATFSRRSRRQIAAWDWTPAPADEVIRRFGFFGPRDDDQPIPVG